MKLRHVLLILISIVSLGVSYTLASAFTETYFFDKLYYQKSSAFGYVPGFDYMHAPIRDARMNGFPLINQNVAGVSTPSARQASDPYTIAVIGDSYVWGLGVKTNERFTNILESKLNAVRPTKVISLGRPGDNFLENTSKYYLLSQHQHVDLYIFLVVFNDVLMMPTIRYPSPIVNQLLADCAGKGTLIHEYIGEDWDAYAADLKMAWDSPANLCLLNEEMDLLPKNAIYLIGDSYWIDYKPYIALLKAHGLHVQELKENSAGIEAYQKYWDQGETNFQVSQKEGHPSKLAHAMYATYLYHELLSNSQWGFAK